MEEINNIIENCKYLRVKKTFTSIVLKCSLNNFECEKAIKNNLCYQLKIQTARERKQKTREKEKIIINPIPETKPGADQGGNV